MSEEPHLADTYMQDILPALNDEGSRLMMMMAAAFDREVDVPVEDLVLCANKLPNGTWAYWFTTMAAIWPEEPPDADDA